ncbi:MAG: glutamate-5-semialdehyde dehydrogenase [Trueperaceae bacterium]|nr:MAG: glutamate-5-semialdehyde dehydrogenase [Trueperaceae bacterium]
MSVTITPNLDLMLNRARVASRQVARCDRVAALQAIADALLTHRVEILAGNARDVESERRRGTPASLVDRLALSESRLEGISEAVHQVALLPDPLHRILDGWQTEAGLSVRKVTVPFGVIGMIYESRPNVTVDAAVLALKAGSAAVLRGSSNALESNRVIVRIMREALQSVDVPADAVQLIDSPDRSLVTALLAARGRVDLVIPRGGSSLINHVVETAKVPVIETGVGNCHVFVDRSADLAKAHSIAINAKVQRPGVCNAAETLLVHEQVATEFLPGTIEVLHEHGVEVRGCELTRDLVPGVAPADEADWAEEYLDLKLAVKVVASLEEAIEHITRYGTMHSEAIVTEDRKSAVRFQEGVDAAAVFVNASTRFTDGFEFGFGAEIGISTQKLHARGPMGLSEIVTYKYLIDGDGQIRGA